MFVRNMGVPSAYRDGFHNEKLPIRDWVAYNARAFGVWARDTCRVATCGRLILKPRYGGEDEGKARDDDSHTHK
jgi:hypothetical protein